MSEATTPKTIRPAAVAQAIANAAALGRIMRPIRQGRGNILPFGITKLGFAVGPESDEIGVGGVRETGLHGDLVSQPCRKSVVTNQAARLCLIPLASKQVNVDLLDAERLGDGGRSRRGAQFR